MSFSGWITAIFVFIIILAIAVGIGWILRNNQTPTPTPPNQYSAPLGWGKPVPGPNSAKNTCQLYTFPTGQVTVQGVPTVIPGTPTFDPQILDNLQGVTGIPACVDSDQTLAQQVQHTCIAPAGVVDGAITRCDLMNGGITGLGGTEVFYTNSNCAKVPACPGELALVSVNFGAPTAPEIKCLTTQGTGASVTMEICDPSNPDQLFRVTRINPGQNPNSLKPGRGQNGLFGQILDRRNNTCLTKLGTGTFSTTFDSAVSANTGCTAGDGTVFSGDGLTFDTCGTGPTGSGSGFPGYNWAFLPSLTVEGTGTVSPPQLTYIADINFSTFPQGTGATVDAIFQWLVNNGAQSMYYGGTGDVLLPTMINGENLPIRIGTNADDCPQLGYTAQYLNLTTYNIISEERVCFADGTLATPQCTDL